MKQLRYLFVFLFTFTLIFTTSANPQTTSPIKIQAGIGVYPDPGLEGKVYIEFPFAVNRDQFDFLPQDSLGDFLLGAVFAEIRLTNLEKVVVDSANVYFLIRARDLADAADKEVRLFNRLSLEVPPGNYSGKLTVIDVISKNEGSFSYDRIEVEPVVKERLKLSSIEFAYKISNAVEGDNPALIKSGRSVIPNPMGLYKEQDDNIYVYAELYNLAYDSTASDSFAIGYSIFDENGVLYHKYADIMQAKPGSSSAVSNALSKAVIEPGRYTLRLTVSDLKSGQTDSARAPFIIFPSAGQTPGLVTYKHRFPYDSCSLSTKLRLAKYFLAPQEMTMLKSLNEAGKERFLNQFFNDRDPDFATDINEFLNELFIRYIYANRSFASLPGQDDGWSRDRGRVLMQYGNWDDREEMLTPSYGKSYEVWTYYKLQGGGIIFVFQDVGGYGDFKLVHSTASGELFDSRWDLLIKSNDPTLVD